MDKIYFRTKFDDWAIGFFIISIVATLVLMPFHATLTVWLSDNFGHYTAFRLWKEALLATDAVLAVYIIACRASLRIKVFKNKLFWLIFAYCTLVVLTGLVGMLLEKITPKATAYGILLDSRFLVFFIVCWVAAELSGLLKLWWKKIVLIPAALVIVFGLLQHFLLPYDFLKHLGYSEEKIPAYSTIDKKLNYVRVQSTLRGANPLGAYLVLVIGVSAALIRRVSGSKLIKLGALLAGAVAVLMFSYSRSAWIGAGICALVVAYLTIKSTAYRKYVAVALVAVVLAGIGSLVLLRHNDHFQNIFFHTDEHSRSATSSNHGHMEGLKGGLADMINQPFGAGPGTAGPASVYNDKAPARIAENYFIQIGQEVGWFGLALFIAINAALARALWQRRHDTLALALLASGLGITAICLLSHAWTDDTLAYLWWGLAGIAYGSIKLKKRSKIQI